MRNSRIQPLSLIIRSRSSRNLRSSSGVRGVKSVSVSIAFQYSDRLIGVPSSFPAGYQIVIWIGLAISPGVRSPK